MKSQEKMGGWLYCVSLNLHKISARCFYTMHPIDAKKHRKLCTAILGLMNNWWNHMLSSPMKVFKTEPDESIQISFLNKSWLNRCDVFVIYDIASFFGAQKLVAQQGLDPKRVALNCCCWPLVRLYPAYLGHRPKARSEGDEVFTSHPFPGKRWWIRRLSEVKVGWIGSTLHLSPFSTLHILCQVWNPNKPGHLHVRNEKSIHESEVHG